METNQKECLLQTLGYQFRLFLRKSQYGKEYLGMITCFSLNAFYGGNSFYTQAAIVPVGDLRALIDYLENHIHLLKSNSSIESPVFLTYDLNFQIHALEGDISLEDQGEFTIRCSVNLNRIGMNFPSTYLGADSLVTVSDVRDFIASLNEALDNLTNS